MPDDHGSVEWIINFVERVIARYVTKGDDPSAKTLIIDNPRVTPAQADEIRERFKGRINLLLSLEGLVRRPKPHQFPERPWKRRRT